MHVKGLSGGIVHSFVVEDKHDVLYTTGKVLVTSDEQFMFTICSEDVKVTDLQTGKLLHVLKGVRASPDHNIHIRIC